MPSSGVLRVLYIQSILKYLLHEEAWKVTKTFQGKIWDMGWSNRGNKHLTEGRGTCEAHRNLAMRYEIGEPLNICRVKHSSKGRWSVDGGIQEFLHKFTEVVCRRQEWTDQYHSILVQNFGRKIVNFCKCSPDTRRSFYISCYAKDIVFCSGTTSVQNPYQLSKMQNPLQFMQSWHHSAFNITYGRPFSFLKESILL